MLDRLNLPTRFTWATIALFGVAALATGCVSEESVAEPAVGTKHYAAPADGPFHTPFQPVKDGYAAVSDRYRARVTEDAILYMYEPAKSGHVGNRGALAFETRSVVRGARTIGLSAPEKVGMRDSLRFSRGSLVELFKSGPKGVEQSWLFDHEIDGDGDLVITVAIGGAEQVESDSEGLHFKAADGSWGVLYEHPVWVDANGRRTNLNARYERGAIVLRVPDAVLSSSAYPAKLDGS
ncbi:MAG: hypothetical protein U0165_19005 [Polyangiaceae bacterium]